MRQTNVFTNYRSFGVVSVQNIYKFSLFSLKNVVQILSRFLRFSAIDVINVSLTRISTDLKISEIKNFKNRLNQDYSGII